MGIKITKFNVVPTKDGLDCPITEEYVEHPNGTKIYSKEKTE